MDTEYDEEPLGQSPRNATRGAQITNYYSNKDLFPYAVIASLALIGIIIGGVMVYNATRETRMLEYYVMELDGKVMQAGIIKPEESWSARKRKENVK